MNGHILQDLPIAVDYFRKTQDVDMFFLTHMHSDHTVGLTSQWKNKLYCTPVTAQLLEFKLKVGQKYIIALEELQSHEMKLKLKSSWTKLNVTLIPANHCPGSCMILFKLTHLSILYTGDFRPNEKIFELGKDLWGPQNPIDILYLDNTYCEPSCEFPSKEESVNKVMEIVKDHENFKICIGISWTGHEELLQNIALKLKCQIVVDSQQLEKSEMLNMEGIFTVQPEASRVYAMPSHRITVKYLTEMNREVNAIGILPTARKCHLRFLSKNNLIFTVPYSNHSSFSELWDFVESVRPQKILPIVKSRSKARGMESEFRCDMSQFDCLLSCRKNETDGPELYPLNTYYDLCDNFNESSRCSEQRRISRHRKRFYARNRRKSHPHPYGVVYNSD